MRKSELLQMPELRVTDQIQQMVREDRCVERSAGYRNSLMYECYEHYLYYRAAVENGILKVAIFSRKQIARGREEPQYELYLSRSERSWIVYEPESGRWLTAKVDMLNYEYDSGHIYGNKPYADESTKEMINQYLGTGRKEVRDAVLTWQLDIQGDQLRKRHRSETDKIDEVMNAVPAEPEDFLEWAEESAFIDCRYIFYVAGRKAAEEGLCSHCGKLVKLAERPYHNRTGECPVCGSMVTYKAWNKQNYITDEKRVALIQRMMDGSGFILREFWCTIKRKREDGWDKRNICLHEIKRAKLDDRFIEREAFEFGEYRNTGVARWCHQIRHSYYYTDYSVYGVLYYRNLDEILKETELKYFPVRKLFERNQGKSLCPDNALRKMITHPEYEFFMKSGLWELTFELLQNERSGIRIDPEGKRPWEILRLTKEQYQMAAGKGAVSNEIRVIQMANENFVRLNWEQVVWITWVLGRSILIEYMRYTTPHKMIRYLKNLGVEEDKKLAGDYHDYLQDCRKLELDFTEQILFPQKFQQAHEDIHIEVIEQENKKEAKRKKEQDMLYREVMGKQTDFLNFEDQDFKIIIPKDKDDFVREGREMHNCVGGYFEKVVKGQCTVLFLRKKEDLDKSFCTVEIQGTKLIQCRSVYNKDAPEPAMKFMKKYLKQMKKKLEKEMKKNDAERKARMAAAV